MALNLELFQNGTKFDYFSFNIGVRQGENLTLFLFPSLFK